MSNNSEKEEEPSPSPPRVVHFVSFSEDDWEEQPSVTSSVFWYWIVPILLIASLTRFAVDPEAPTGLGMPAKAKPPAIVPTPTPSPTPLVERQPTPVPTLVAEKPSDYIQTYTAIHKQRKKYSSADPTPMGGYSDNSSVHKVSSPTPTKTTTTPKKPQPREETPRGASTDPVRKRLRDAINTLRKDHEVGCVSVVWIALLFV